MRLKKEYWLVGLVVFVAFLLRVYKIDTDLLFHRDQGLFALDIYKIWHEKKLTLLGPYSDGEGIRHAATYFYLVAPFYALGKGDVAWPAIAQIFFEISTLPLLYLAAKRFFDKRSAFITIILYAASYGMISYSRWFLQVPVILPLTNILLFVLSRKSKNKILYSFFLVGSISQLNAAVGVFYLPFLIYYFWGKLNPRKLLLSTAAFLLPAVPLIVFQFRHEFVTAKAVWRYLFKSSEGIDISLFGFYRDAITFLKEVNRSFLYPFHILSSFIFVWGLASVWKTKNKRLFWAFLFIPFLLLGFMGRDAIGFFYMASLPVVLMVVSFGISRFRKELYIVLTLLIVGLNFLNLERIYRPTNALIPIGNSNLITLQDRKNVIDWMYEKADGEDFSLWIYTIPYFQDYPWEYLFITYSKDKYGYLPEKTKSFSPRDLERSVYFFNVYEIDYDNKSRQDAWFNEVDKNFGEIIDFYRSNDVFVELRKQ